MSLSTMLPPNLQEIEAEILEYATAEGLDFPEVRFIMLDFTQMNQVAAYDGFPSRYPHWRFGMEYERLRKSYAYGLHRIYEMVINTDPCYAYLLASNLAIDQKLVMAHVYGHADFFKNNLWFAHTNRRMLDDMANHATRIRRLVDKHGLDEVETFADRCLSLDNLIDLHGPGIIRQPIRVEEGSSPVQEAGRLPNERGYMDEYINPPAYLEAQRERFKQEQQKEYKFPANPQRDLLLFLLESAPLSGWQQDILSIVRDEAYYFAPQRQTKIMNEGWATYWHSHIMTRHALRPEELIDYADHHSGTVATSPGRLNPYKLGVELFRD
ncbi:MAG TPA: SpoVR family protein, partial [Caldilineaceae bacterium]|nr:SpoVR family protein [Caldilineaceae bacterium]